MEKKAKSQGFSIRGFDREHYRQTERYVQAIDQLYSSAIHSFSRLAGSVKVDTDKPFNFADSPAFQRRAQAIVNELAHAMTAVIQHGTREQWLYACKKNDAFIDHIMDTTKVGKRQLKKMQDKNLDALDAFQSRKVQGMDLSQRVWHYAGQTKGLMEMGIDIAVGDGRSAEELSRDLREYLVEPDKLFRRVRDKHGNLVLSKRAAAYHPGQGVYRSSYKNAMRLTRTEINMAYRNSDQQRWANMDFVVGIRVHLSNNHTLNGKPFHDICDELAGDYPKYFDLGGGWHPQCRCFMTPILQDPDEFKTDELNEMKAAFFGTEYKKYQSRKEVTDVPDSFKEWARKNKKKSLNWAKQPYWIRNNFEGGTLEGGLVLKKPVIPKPIEIPKRYIDLSEDEQKDLRARWESMYSRDVFEQIKKACDDYKVDGSLFFDLDSRMPDEYEKLDQLQSEYKHLTGTLDDTAKRIGSDAKNLYDKAIAAWNDSKVWARSTPSRDIIDIKWNGITSWRWPDYPVLIDDLQKFYDERMEGIKTGKSVHASAIYDAGVVIKKAEKTGVDSMDLQKLIITQPTESHNAVTLVREIRAEMNRLEVLISQKDANNNATSELNEVVEELKKKNIEYREVKMYKKQPTEQQIIDHVSGGDLTIGSCASLAFTYAANRGGMDVLDFRGGDSLDYFANYGHLTKIAEHVKAKIPFTFSTGLQMMKQTEIGKEYYLAIACHAAIVRQVSKGVYEYLELQSAHENGWKKLDRRVFEWRFSARGSNVAVMMDINDLINDPSFKKMMGYINTESSKQRKSEKGSIK